MAAAHAALTEEKIKYTELGGTHALRSAIAKYLKTLGTEYTPEQVIVSSGAKQGLLQVLFALCEAGDEVIIPAPYWPSYPQQVRLCGATPVIVPTAASDGYCLQPADLERALTPSTHTVSRRSTVSPGNRVPRDGSMASQRLGVPTTRQWAAPETWLIRFL